MSRPNRKRISTESDSSLSNHPFAQLPTDALGDLPAGPTPPSTPPSKPSSKPAGTLRVRMEKKGRGGKVVTVIDGRDVPSPHRLQALLDDLKKQLGTGGKLEGKQIVLQGEPSPRLAALLHASPFIIKGLSHP